LELETCTVAQTRFKDEFDILEGVAENAVAAAFEVGAFPVVLEFLETIEHRIKTEVHRAHVKARDFRVKRAGRAGTFRHRHRRRAAARQIDDDVRGLLDAWYEF